MIAGSAIRLAPSPRPGRTMPFSPAYRAEGRESRCEGCRTRGPVVVTDALIAYWTERYSAEQIRELGAAFVS